MMVMCLAGMNTVDIYLLKKEDYKDGIIADNITQMIPSVSLK